MGKPVIGVFPLWDNKKSSIWMLPGYLDGIFQAGGVSVILPLTTDTVILEQICEMVDGLLFTGGQDIFPGRYGQDTIPACKEICVARDILEDFIFSRAVLKMDKPAFGICRGLQLFNVLLGGSLYQDLPTQYKGTRSLCHQQAYALPSHNVFLVKESPLHLLIGKDVLAVNSDHHQGICELSKELTYMAKADDGIIEAVCMPGKKFVWAVQWHPECTLHDASSQKLFGSFVDACKQLYHT